MPDEQRPDKPDINLLNWLGLNETPSWRNSRGLGALLGCLILLLFALSVFAAFTIVYTTIWSALQPSSPGPNLGTGALITGLLGAPFLIWRTMVAQQTVNLQREGHITDRISKAVEQLGAEKTIKEIHEIQRYQREGDGWRRDENGHLIPALRPDGTPLIDRESLERTVPNIEVRVGGLYALERIAQDSMAHEGGREHLTVMEIMCTYIRENARAADLNWTEPPFDRTTPRTDIQVALTIIGRRSKAQTDLEAVRKYRLDLRNSNLDGCDFRRGNFSAARFHRSRFEAAQFDEAKLHGSQFFGTLLNYASFWKAELIGTYLDRSTINRPEYSYDGFVESINMAAINGISLAGADVTALDYIGEPEVMNKTFVTKDTKLADALDETRADLRKKQLELRRAVRTGDTARASVISDELFDLGVTHWSPYDSSDMSTGPLRKNFLDALGLTGWPYQEP